MKDWIIVALVLVILLILFRRSSSSVPAPSNCNPKLVDKNAVCSNVFPRNSYPTDGPISSDDPTKKYCCQ